VTEQNLIMLQPT